MSVQFLLLPVFAQIVLTFFLMVWMARTRFASVRRGEVTARDLKDDWTCWPQRPAQIAAAFHNQFQLPVLFYVLVILALVTTQADMVFVALSWLFVVSRVMHAYIHTGHNDLQMRFGSFLVGALVLMVMWLYVFLKLSIGL